MSTEQLWNDTDRAKVTYSEKNLSLMPLYPQQISQGLAWYSNRASAVSGRWLTAWAAARPLETQT